MYDCRETLIEALQVLSQFVEQDTSAEDSARRSASGVLNNFHHQYAVWCFNYDDVLDSVNRKPLDKLHSIVDDMLMASTYLTEGWEQDWTDEAVKTSPKWSRIRSLAETSLPIARKLILPVSESSVACDDLRIVEYTCHVPNPPKPEDTEEGEYGVSENDVAWYSLRQDLVLVCGKHGRVGPDDPTREPQFYVIDDRYNEERYQYMEFADASCVTNYWFADVVEVLRRHPGWGVVVCNTKEEGLLIFGDRVMVKGEPMRHCKTANDVVEAMVRRISKHSSE